jgi:phosphoglycerate dehydrogenase-like enzyme
MATSWWRRSATRSRCVARVRVVEYKSARRALRPPEVGHPTHFLSTVPFSRAPQLKELIKDYDGLVVRSGVKVTEDVSHAASRGRGHGHDCSGLHTRPPLWHRRLLTHLPSLLSSHTTALHAVVIACAQIISAGTKLKVIGRAGAGVDNIDTVAATKR